MTLPPLDPRPQEDDSRLATRPVDSIHYGLMREPGGLSDESGAPRQSSHGYILLTKAANQTIPDNAGTTIAFDTVVYNLSHGAFLMESNSVRLLLPELRLYHIFGMVDWVTTMNNSGLFLNADNPATGLDTIASVRLNVAGETGGQYNSISWIGLLPGNTLVTMSARNDTGGDRTSAAINQVALANGHFVVPHLSVTLLT